MNTRTLAAVTLGLGVAAISPIGSLLAGPPNPAGGGFDAGGGRITGGSTAMVGCLGGLGGIASAGAMPVVARHGFAGQLFELRSLNLTASPSTVDETGTSRLEAQAVLDDHTRLQLPPTSIAWRILECPIASISSSGLATASTVYQTSPATVSAAYQVLSGTLPLTVRNVGTDDFGAYAHDGLEDAWQVRWFGLDNPAASPTADPDGDRADNANEYGADTIPVSAASVFQISIEASSGGVTIGFSSSPRRVYTLYVTTDVTAGGWTIDPEYAGIRGTGGVHALSDPAPPDPRKFYRLGVTLP